MRVYRVLHPRHAETPLDGEGSFRFGGRWSSPGTRVAYTSSTSSLAKIEYLIHSPEDLLPATELRICVIDVPDKTRRRIVDEDTLPSNWRDVPGPVGLQTIGDEWIRKAEEAVLDIPSIHVATGIPERNFLISPQHSDVRWIKVVARLPFLYDARLLRRPRRK